MSQLNVQVNGAPAAQRVDLCCANAADWAKLGIIFPSFRMTNPNGGVNFYNGPALAAPIVVVAASQGAISEPVEFDGTHDVTIPLAYQPFKTPLPHVPSRDAVCNGQTTQQGFYVTTTQFGAMPWWGACWAWLTPSDRALAAHQLLAHGDTVCLIERPSGVPLYDEAGNFYSPDKFPALSMSDADVVALVKETLGYGFAAVWIFLGGDDGSAGYPIAVAQVESLAPAMGTLNAYACYFPGWDGVFYGYTPDQVAAFAAAARAAGALYVGMEFSTGHIPVGNGPSDYEPDGLMTGYDVILGEFNDGQFDDTVWQVLPRMGRPYHRPADQPSGDDPNPPFYLAPPSPRGPFFFRIFEYYIYGWVRGTPASVVAASRAQFQAMAPTNVIC